MGIANIGGAASPQVIYGKNSTGAALEPGDVVEVRLVDGLGDGYEFVTPDIDLAKPESLFARCGVVVAADGPIEIEFQDGANIAVQVEGPVSEVTVDGDSDNIVAGDLLIKQDGSSNLVKMLNTTFTVPSALTDSSGGTGSARFSFNRRSVLNVTFAAPSSADGVEALKRPRSPDAQPMPPATPESSEPR